MPGVKDWLKKASSDLKASKKLLEDDDTLDCAIFHTHQCAEKMFKAFLIFAQQTIPKTHDLGLLLLNCTKTNPKFMILLRESKDLNPYSMLHVIQMMLFMSISSLLTKPRKWQKESFL